MTLLSQVRRAGATIRLDGDNIALRRANPAVIDLVKLHKAGIVAELRAEALTGPGYVGSGLFWRLGEIYESAYQLAAIPSIRDACGQLAWIVGEIDDKGYELGLAAAQAETAKMASSASALLVQILAGVPADEHPVEGAALAQIARTVFPDGQTSHVAAALAEIARDALTAPAPVKPKPRVDVTAFAGDLQGALL